MPPWLGFDTGKQEIRIPSFPVSRNVLDNTCMPIVKELLATQEFSIILKEEFVYK